MADDDSPSTTPGLAGRAARQLGERELGQLERDDLAARAARSCARLVPSDRAPAIGRPRRCGVAERAGFEPATGCPEPHFQCGAIVH